MMENSSAQINPNPAPAALSSVAPHRA